MITFHVARWPPVEDSQPGATDMDSGLCSLLNARHRIPITHWHTHTTDSLMFSLAPILPTFDVRCGNRPNSIIRSKQFTNNAINHTKLLTTHIIIWYQHLTLLKWTSDPSCPLCEEEQETSLHFLGRCNATMARRMQYFK